MKGIKTGGRSKGTPNKLTADVKAMILMALDQAGGVNYLVQQAADSPCAFLALVGKVLPLTVSNDTTNPMPAPVQFIITPVQPVILDNDI